MLLITYLPNILEFLGKSRKLTSHPAVSEVFKIVPEIVIWQVHILSTSLTVTEC